MNCWEPRRRRGQELESRRRRWIRESCPKNHFSLLNNQLLTNIIFYVIIIPDDRFRRGVIYVRFKVLREKANLTQAQIAEALNIGQSTVSMWESGENLPRADKLPQLARLLNCTVDELLGDGERDSA